MKTFKSITVLTIAIVAVCCTTAKRAAKSETVAKIESTQVDSTAQVTRQKIDLVMRSVSELREAMAEWLNENIDYTEHRYDSLGRLISSIRQTTNRSTGKETATIADREDNIGFTAVQLDSIVAGRMAEFVSQINTKEAAGVSIGLAWWQKVLMYLGVASIIAGLFFVALRIIKRFL